MSHPTVAEIVTFRLKEGTTNQAFLEAMAAMEPFIARSGGMLGRTLSCDEEGLWTDHVLWESEAQAKALAEAFMTAPETELARELIDGNTVSMRHAPVILHM